jgi:hypothetical protein
MAMTALTRFFIKFSRVWTVGPMDSFGDRLLVSKKSNIISKVMELDAPIFLLKTLNFLAIELLKLMVVNCSFSYPLSIFTLKIHWFYWSEHLFTLKINVLNITLIIFIFLNNCKTVV